MLEIKLNPTQMHANATLLVTSHGPYRSPVWLTQQQQQQNTFIRKAQISTVTYEQRNKTHTFKHGSMTTVEEECQLIFYNYKKLEKAEIQRVENKEGGKRKKK